MKRRKNVMPDYRNAMSTWRRTILSAIEQAIPPSVEYIDFGGFGIIYRDKNTGHIIKLTSDNTEAEIAHRIFTGELSGDYWPRIYGVRRLGWLHRAIHEHMPTTGVPQFYTIEREDVPPFKAIGIRKGTLEEDFNTQQIVVSALNVQAIRGLVTPKHIALTLTRVLGEMHVLRQRAEHWGDIDMRLRIEIWLDIAQHGYFYTDMYRQNLGTRADGTLVVRDMGIPFNTHDFNFNRIPETSVL